MKPILVGEIGINHNGDMALAKRLIDEAGAAGLDYVKFQKRTVDTVYTQEFLDSPRESPWGSTQGDQKRGLEFSDRQYAEIDRAVLESKLTGWFASPWDPESAGLLASFGVPYMKVPSALVTDVATLEAIRDTGIPAIVSTGMSTKQEIDNCLDVLRGNVAYILACRSAYPTKAEDINLWFMETLRGEYPGIKIGFSNHHPGITACMSAAALGAEMIEFHVTADRSMYGSDQSASIEIPGMQRLARAVGFIDAAMGTGEWGLTEDEIRVRRKLRP